MSWFDLSIALFFLGLVTSFIGTNTGGASLITIPAMIALGIPPNAAIATARTTSVGTVFAGLRQYHKKGKVDYGTAWPAAILSVIGAGLGALFMTHVPVSSLNKIIGGLTLTLLILSYALKQVHNPDAPPSSGKKYFGYSLFLFTSMLGGFYGGQGIITTYIFMIFFNKTITESAGTRKINALATAVAAALIYGFHDLINWRALIALACGTILGATLGARYALKKGDAWLDKIFTVVTVLLAIKLLVF